MLIKEEADITIEGKKESVIYSTLKGVSVFRPSPKRIGVTTQTETGKVESLWVLLYENPRSEDNLLGTSMYYGHDKGLHDARGKIHPALRKGWCSLPLDPNV